ncbi:MAG TPA: methylmalonyl Co-A mutase-associated GTPase MeaB [Polyangiaceae bacterium]|nr:methylmalonyl Co-A mutase-associated GTPase MeaB [Polyangiaceae bacterium]
MPHPRIPETAFLRRRELSVNDYVQGVLAGDRATLGRAITLVESVNPEHEQLAEQVLLQLLPHSGKAMRVGITGIPGAGKSTFIEAMGRRLTSEGHRVAVLAIDPSSATTGGSILGDKTRMVELSADPRAFIRPSPSSGTLGGVARKTRETMVVCEAGGFDVLIIETVGVGQSETMVDSMVDFFLVLMVAGAGDELQGIKRGVLELADLIAVNKADGDNVLRAELACREYATALHFMRQKHEVWTPMAQTCSSITGHGLTEIWAAIERHRKTLIESGLHHRMRQRQLVQWMWSMIEERLQTAFSSHPRVVQLAPSVEHALTSGEVTAARAATTLLEAFGIGV